MLRHSAGLLQLLQVWSQWMWCLPWRHICKCLCCCWCVLGHQLNCCLEVEGFYECCFLEGLAVTYTARIHALQLTAGQQGRNKESGGRQQQPKLLVMRTKAPTFSCSQSL